MPDDEHFDDVIVRFADLKPLGITFSRPYIRKLIALGLFPTPFVFGKNSVGWWLSEIRKYRNNLPRRTYGRGKKGGGDHA
jgi:hypothetical protein